MALPPDHPFVKVRNRLDAGFEDLLRRCADYEAQQRKFRTARARLLPQERQEYLALLGEYYQVLVTYQRGLFGVANRFEALLHRVRDDQLQKDLAGLDEELRQLWRERPPSEDH